MNFWIAVLLSCFVFSSQGHEVFVHRNQVVTLYCHFNVEDRIAAVDIFERYNGSHSILIKRASTGFHHVFAEKPVVLNFTEGRRKEFYCLLSYYYQNGSLESQEVHNTTIFVLNDTVPAVIFSAVPGTKITPIEEESTKGGGRKEKDGGDTQNVVEGVRQRITIVSIAITILLIILLLCCYLGCTKCRKGGVGEGGGGGHYQRLVTRFESWINARIEAITGCDVISYGLSRRNQNGHAGRNEVSDDGLNLVSSQECTGITDRSIIRSQLVLPLKHVSLFLQVTPFSLSKEELFGTEQACIPVQCTESDDQTDMIHICGDMLVVSTKREVSWLSEHDCPSLLDTITAEDSEDSEQVDQATDQLIPATENVLDESDTTWKVSVPVEDIRNGLRRRHNRRTTLAALGSLSKRTEHIVENCMGLLRFRAPQPQSFPDEAKSGVLTADPQPPSILQEYGSVNINGFSSNGFECGNGFLCPVQVSSPDIQFPIKSTLVCGGGATIMDDCSEPEEKNSFDRLNVCGVITHCDLRDTVCVPSAWYPSPFLDEFGMNIQLSNMDDSLQFKSQPESLYCDRVKMVGDITTPTRVYSNPVSANSTVLTIMLFTDINTKERKISNIQHFAGFERILPISLSGYGGGRLPCYHNMHPVGKTLTTTKDSKLINNHHITTLASVN